MLWQRFGERTKKVVFYAQEEAVRRGKKGVASEHLLLALLRNVQADVYVWPPPPLGSSPAGDFAGALLHGIDFEALYAETERQEALAATPAVKNIMLTPSATKIIDYAYEEARQVKASHITTEFLLLALARDDQGSAGRTLASLGPDLAAMRRKVADAYLPAEQEKAIKPSLRSRLFAKRPTAPGEKEIR